MLGERLGGSAVMPDALDCFWIFFVFAVIYVLSYAGIDRGE